MPDVKDTRKKILEAALDWIAREGASNLTTRKIAELAGVNAASTNYYFRTKDALIEEAMLLFMEKISVAFSHLEDISLPPERRVYLFIKGYLEKLLEYPGILKTEISLMMELKDPIPRLLASKQEIFKHFLELVPLNAGKPPEPRFVEIMSAVVYPVLTAAYVKGYAGLDLKIEKDRDLYIKTLLRDLMDMDISKI